MARYVRSAKTNQDRGLSVEVKMPTHESGDLLLVHVAQRNGTAFNAGTGIWTKVNETAQSGLIRTAYYYGIATGSDMSLTISSTANNDWAIICHVIKGHDPITPVTGTEYAASGSASGSNPSYPSVTTANDNSLIFHHIGTTLNNKSVIAERSVSHIDMYFGDTTISACASWSFKQSAGATPTPEAYIRSSATSVASTIAITDADPTGTAVVPPHIDPSAPFIEVLDPLWGTHSAPFASNSMTGLQSILDRVPIATANDQTFNNTDISGNQITITAHGYQKAGRYVVKIDQGANTVDSNLTNGGYYSIVYVDDDTISLASTTTSAQTVLTLAGDGSGTITLLDIGFEDETAVNTGGDDPSGVSSTYRINRINGNTEMLWFGCAVDLNTPRSLDGELVGFSHKLSTIGTLNDSSTMARYGVTIVFIDTNNNWRSFLVNGRDSLKPYGAQWVTNYVNPGDATTAIHTENVLGSFDADDIDRVGFLFRMDEDTAAFRASIYNLHKLNVSTPGIVLGGCSDFPISPKSIADLIYSLPMSEYSALSQGNTQGLFYQPVQIGNGTDDVYVDFNGGSMEFAPAFNQANGEISFQGGDDLYGLIIRATAGSTVNVRNCGISGGNSFMFTLHASTSTSATYDFSGAFLSNASLSLISGVTIDGTIFTNCSELDVGSLTIQNCSFSNPRTSNQLAYRSVGSTDSSVNTFRTDDPSDHLYELDSSSGVITWSVSNKNFLGSTIPIIVSGTNDITISVGSGVVGLSTSADVQNNLTGGATLSVNSDKSVEINNLISGSLLYVEDSSDGSEIIEVSSTGTSESFSVPSGTVIDVWVKNDGYEDWSVKSQTISSGVTFSAEQNSDAGDQ